MGGFEYEPDSNTEVGEYVDQSIGAEQVDPASTQIAYPWLADAAPFCQLSLGKTFGLDKSLDLDH